MNDLRYALRSLRTSRVFSLIAISALAIGIGMNTAIFSLVNALLLRPLPYRETQRLVSIHESNPSLGFTQAQASFATYEDWAKERGVFSAVAAYDERGFSITDANAADPRAERVAGGAVSASLFRLLGVAPELGRTWLPDEDRPGGERVVVLGHDLWQSRYAGDPRILGRRVTIDGIPHTVLGVMPSGFDFYEVGAIWVPIAPLVDRIRRDDRSVSVVARLANGVSIEQAQTQMTRVHRGIAATFPATNAGWDARVERFGLGRDDGVGIVALILLGATVLVLLIVCANVANLLLARAAAREREIAVRAALGASRARLVRQLVTEGVMLGVIGGGLGMLLASYAVDILVAMMFPPDLPIPKWIHFGVDGRVLAFNIVASLATVILFGLAPALHATRGDLQQALKAGGTRGGSGRERHRTRDALVVSQVALSLILLVGAGLLLRSVAKVQQIDLGFDPQGVLAMTVTLPEARYASPDQPAAYAERALETVRGRPGVRAAAIFGGNSGPGMGDLARDLAVESGTPPASESLRGVRLQSVTPGYFDALRIGLRRGRAFTEADGRDAAPTVIINAALAQRLWPNASPLGRHLRIDATNPTSPWREIIGVVADVRVVDVGSRGLGAAPRPEMYVPLAQRPDRVLNVIVRASCAPTAATSVDSCDPSIAAPALRQALLALDPEQPVYQVMPLERSTGFFQRFLGVLASLLAAFAGVALLLAAMGIYGVVAYTVGRRTREIGIRMALGARAADVVRLVLGQGARNVAVGLALGSLGALGLTRVLRVLLYEVGTADPQTFAGVAVTLAAAAIAAAWVPARRATRVEPVVALRSE